MSGGGGCGCCCPKCGCQKTCTCNHSMPGLDETMGDFSYAGMKTVAGANSCADMKPVACANGGSISESFHSETTTEKHMWVANSVCQDGTWDKGSDGTSITYE